MPPVDGGEPSTAPQYGGSRGGGGKIRRERKPQSTPYDRPPRWISRVIVDPAKRILSVGATRFLPSLFSSSPSSSDEVHEEAEVDTGDCREHNENVTADLVAPQPSGGVSSTEPKGKLKLNVSDNDGLDERRGQSDGVVPDIEQLITGKTFSREQIDHLMDILRSRVVDVDEERKRSSPIGLEVIEKPQSYHENHKGSVIQEEETDRFVLASSTPLQQPMIRDEVGASPVDIARAYMGSRISEVGFPSTSLTSRNKNFGPTSESASKSFMPSPLPKAPICWPGAITHNQQGYATPQPQRSRYGLNSFPRTPYSRTIYTKSKSKLTPLRGDNESLSNNLLTPLQPLGTPAYGKSTFNLKESGYGSGGPIRRTRDRFTSATPFRDSVMSRSVQKSPLSKESNADSILKKSSEPVGSSSSTLESTDSKGLNSEVGVPSVHPHSSKLARQILEQIDRPLTLKQKSKELKLAASWKSSSSDALPSPVQNISSTNISRIGVNKSLYLDGTKHISQKNDGNNTFSHENAYTGSSHSRDDVASGSMINAEKKGFISGINNEQQPNQPKLASQTSSPEQISNNNPPERNSLFVGDKSKGRNIANKSSRSEVQNGHRKPLLPSIAIDKSGFTFPVTTSSNTFSDLPTPSMVPSSLTCATQKSDVSSSAPITGGKITIAPPVFSFPPASAASTPNDITTPKFRFGSEKSRLSFALEGDATSSPVDAPIVKYKFGSGKTRLNFGLMSSAAVQCLQIFW